MLSDLLAFCLAPYPWYPAPMGYVRELSGMGRRNAQCVEAWRPHLEASKRAILAASSGRSSTMSAAGAAVPCGARRDHKAQGTELRHPSRHVSSPDRPSLWRHPRGLFLGHRGQSRACYS